MEQMFMIRPHYTLLTKVESFDDGDCEEAKECCIQFFVAHGEPPVFFEFAKEYLDTPPQFIDGFIVDDLSFAIFPTWNHRHIVICLQGAAMLIAVITHIFGNMTSYNICGEIVRHANVSNIAARKQAFNHMIVRADRQMELGCYPSAVAAAGELPPF